MSGAHAGYYASLNGFLRVVLGNVFLGRELLGGFHCSAWQGHLLGERGKQHASAEPQTALIMKIIENLKL